MLPNLKKISAKTVGLKQTMKAVRSGRAREVYLARDVDGHLSCKVADLCNSFQVPVIMVDSMKELGEACGIQVGAAAAAILKESTE
ncbi:MAG TPA: 50S ribosomal protein L7ae-like protein [Clostridiales bacterium]|nr:50S ribosomal protein L7ae-like protein [Clostridiales bacterium]